MKSWIAFWNILVKDMRNYYLKPPNISWGLVFPVAWTLMFFLKSSTPVDVRQLLPGVMSLSVLFGTTSMLSVALTFERKSRSFERLLLAPLDLSLLMLAKTSGAVLFGLFNAFVPVFFATFMTDLSDIRWLPILGAVFMISLTSTLLGLFTAVAVKEVFEAQTFSNFFRFPMIFLCGLFIPVQELPFFLQPVSYVLPLTYGTDILKTAISQNGHLALSLNFGLLLVFAAGLFAISIRNVKLKWIY